MAFKTIMKKKLDVNLWWMYSVLDSNFKCTFNFDTSFLTRYSAHHVESNVKNRLDPRVSFFPVPWSRNKKSPGNKLNCDGAWKGVYYFISIFSNMQDVSRHLKVCQKCLISPPKSSRCLEML